MLLYAFLLGTQHYEVRIKGKWSNPRKWVTPSLPPLCTSYWKGSLRVALDYVSNKSDFGILGGFFIFFYSSRVSDFMALLRLIMVVFASRFYSEDCFVRGVILFNASNCVSECPVRTNCPWELFDIYIYIYKGGQINKICSCKICYLQTIHLQIIYIRHIGIKRI